MATEWPTYEVAPWLGGIFDVARKYRQRLDAATEELYSGQPAGTTQPSTQPLQPAPSSTSTFGFGPSTTFGGLSSGQQPSTQTRLPLPTIPNPTLNLAGNRAIGAISLGNLPASYLSYFGVTPTNRTSLTSDIIQRIEQDIARQFHLQRYGVVPPQLLQPLPPSTGGYDPLRTRLAIEQFRARSNLADVSPELRAFLPETLGTGVVAPPRLAFPQGLQTSFQPSLSAAALQSAQAPTTYNITAGPTLPTPQTGTTTTTTESVTEHPAPGGLSLSLAQALRRPQLLSPVVSPIFLRSNALPETSLTALRRRLLAAAG